MAQPKAINIAPSQYWEGNDGSWSTFAVQIGNPPQTVRVLPASSGSSIWAVLPEGCAAEDDPENCGTQRGVLFDPANSTTFQRVGGESDFFQLPYETEASLGYAGNAIVGYDNVELGWPGAGGPALPSQVIAGYADKDNMLGLLGLTPRPVNVTSFIDRKPSPLGTLANENKTIPSSYWAYTAGAQYRTPRTQASLVFGGYDSLRGDLSKGLVVPMSTDTNRDLVVAINSISITTPSPASNVSVTGLPILALIDSVVPDIWLPLSACQVFETAFGLTYNSTAGKYFINETQHTSLLAQNSSVTFSLSPSTSSPLSAQVPITLPYASFDLTASYPVGGLTPNQTSRYFPLQRAANSTQFTLGRTFFQETYISVDYPRSEFRLTQALFPTDPSTSNLISISAPGSSTTSSSPPPLGAIIGIAIGGALLLLALATFLFLRHRRSRSEAREKAMEEKLNQVDEALRRQNAAENEKLKPELDATTTAVGRERGRWELDADENEAKTPWSASEGGGDADEKYNFASPGGFVGLDARRHEVPDNMLNEAQGNDGAVEMNGRGVVGELDSRQRVELDAGDQGWKSRAVELPAEKYD